MEGYRAGGIGGIQSGEGVQVGGGYRMERGGKWVEGTRRGGVLEEYRTERGASGWRVQGGEGGKWVEGKRRGGGQVGGGVDDRVVPGSTGSKLTDTSLHIIFVYYR